jgi:hypothetical protein
VDDERPRWRWALIVGTAALPIAVYLGHPWPVLGENPSVSARDSDTAVATVVGGCRREDSFHFGVCETRVSYVDGDGAEHVATLRITDFVRQSDKALVVRYDNREPDRATFVRGNPNDFERYGTSVFFTLAAAFYSYVPALMLVALLRRLRRRSTGPMFDVR